MYTLISAVLLATAAGSEHQMVPGCFSPLMSNISVEYSWRISPLIQWCICEGGCVPPGGVCLPEQSYKVDSYGNTEILRSCIDNADGVGAISLGANSVRFEGPGWSRAAHEICTADCCGSTNCDSCFVGIFMFAQDQKLVFSAPVWPKWFDDMSDAGGTGPKPRREFNLTLTDGAVLSEFRFTLERADFDASGEVDGGDLARLLSAWQQYDGPGGIWARMDLNEDGAIDGGDIGMLLLAWGPVN
jgi:hypothetical protein